MEHCYLLLRCAGWVVREGSERELRPRPEKAEARREAVDVIARADRADLPVAEETGDRAVGPDRLPDQQDVHVGFSVEVPPAAEAAEEQPAAEAGLGKGALSQQGLEVLA